MQLAVDRDPLGPTATNAYVVRAERGAVEAVVVVLAEPRAARR